jgi:hypothetical protein
VEFNAKINIYCAVERPLLEAGKDERIILKLLLRKEDGKGQTGFIQLRIRTSGCQL